MVTCIFMERMPGGDPGHGYGTLDSKMHGGDIRPTRNTTILQHVASPFQRRHSFANGYISCRFSDDYATVSMEDSYPEYGWAFSAPLISFPHQEDGYGQD